jgi:hypothetical protein
VERRLGVSEDKCRCIYKTAKETIFVDYAEAACKGPINGWNVPADTVLKFTVYPKAPLSFSELNLDKGKFVKTSDSPMTTYFTDTREGIKYAIQREYLAHIEYIPSDKDNHLRCEGFPAYDGEVTQYRPYATFSKKTDDEMFARLDDLASQITTGDMWIGYIIAYAGKVSKKGEAKLIAERARQYLIRKRSIPPERVAAIDGGFRENAEIELYLIQRTMPPPTPTPTLSLSEVRVISKPKN